MPKLSEASRTPTKLAARSAVRSSGRTTHFRSRRARMGGLLSGEIVSGLSRRECLDQPAIGVVVARPGPGQAGHLVPGALGRPTLVADPVRGVDEARAVVSSDTVEVDRLPARVGEQI